MPAIAAEAWVTGYSPCTVIFSLWLLKVLYLCVVICASPQGSSHFGVVWVPSGAAYRMRYGFGGTPIIWGRLDVADLQEKLGVGFTLLAG